jgi:hypothetical protein
MLSVTIVRNPSVFVSAWKLPVESGWWENGVRFVMETLALIKPGM